jgi:CDP-L-myo-inositol myo-inositolphosphotransferase
MSVVFLAAEGDPSWEIAGLSVAERTRRAFDVAGVDPARVAEGPRLLVARDALLEPEAVRALTADGDPTLARAIDGAAAAAAARLPADVAVPADAPGLERILTELDAQGRVESVPVLARCQRVRTQAEAARVERAMLEALIQPTDGFFARHFDRHVSIRFSLALLRLGVAPNTITLVATAIGLAGAWLLAAAVIPVQVLGALLFILSTILDGSDGEVARLGLRQSEFGRKLDLACDNVVNGAVFLAIGWVTLRGDTSALAWFAVGATLFGVAFASGVGFWYSGWLERSGRDGEALHAYESLASRDWAYLVLGLAIFGKLHWMIWAAAVGSNAVGVLLIVLRLRGWPPPSAAAGGDPSDVAAAVPAAVSPDGEWA